MNESGRSQETFDRKAALMHRMLRGVFGQTVRHLRGEQRLTQRSLAERAGISREQVVAIETGRSGLSDKVLAKLLVAFDLSPWEFLVTAAWQTFPQNVALKAILEARRPRFKQIDTEPAKKAGSRPTRSRPKVEGAAR